MKTKIGVRPFTDEKGRYCFVAALVLTVLVVSWPVAVRSRTWRVNPGGTGDAPTIQAAISAAVSNDTILLAAGTYTGPGNRDVSFLGKGVVVRSESGPAVTVVDCQGLGRGFSFVSGEGRTAVLTGLTITNGTAQRGGAVYITQSHPTIRGNVITMSSADYGGGICVDQGSGAPITDNLVTANTALQGGGVYCGMWSAPQLEGNVIRGNHAQQRGGGIGATDCMGLVISFNEISNNSAQEGGGIYVRTGTEGVTRNSIWGNTAGTGGGMSLNGDESDNNLVWDNTAGVGAGVYVSSWGGTIVNSTIAHNHGDGVYTDNTNAGVTNTIIAFNEGAGISCLVIMRKPTVTCCDVFGNTNGDVICGTDGGGNFHADPLFCGAPADSAYFLHGDSPCAPANNSCASLVGALPVGCGPLPPPPSVVGCPDDVIVPAMSTVPLIVLDGFTIVNLDAGPRSFFYHVGSEGPAALSDNGDPASLDGVTPVLAPAETYSPPAAALVPPAIRERVVQVVTYQAFALGNPALAGECATMVTFEPPVPVFVQDFTAEALEKGVGLAWRISSDESFLGFRVYREGAGETGTMLAGPEGVIPADVRSYVDTSVEPGCSYRYVLAVVLTDGEEVRSQAVTVRAKTSALELRQNVPNPFNPATKISFYVPERTMVTLSIYDVEGNRVRTLVDGMTDGGYQDRIWDGRDANGNQVGSGVYFCRLAAGGRTLTRKMVHIE